MHKNTMKTPSRQFKCSFRHKQNCEITNGISMLNTLVSNVAYIKLFRNERGHLPFRNDGVLGLIKINDVR